MALLQNAMIIAGINPFWQLIVVGVVLLVSVGLDQFARDARPCVTAASRSNWRTVRPLTAHAEHEEANDGTGSQRFATALAALAVAGSAYAQAPGRPG